MFGLRWLLFLLLGLLLALYLHLLNFYSLLSLLLLLGSLLLCLLLGVGVAWSRGLDLQVQPSWLVEEQTQLSEPQPGDSDGIAPIRGHAAQSALPAGT